MITSVEKRGGGWGWWGGGGGGGGGAGCFVFRWFVICVVHSGLFILPLCVIAKLFSVYSQT